MIKVRNVFQAKYGKGDELVQLMKESLAVWAMEERRNVRIMTDLSGPFFTVVTESEWDSYSAFETGAQELFGDARFAEWFERMVPLVESGRRDFYNIVE